MNISRVTSNIFAKITSGHEIWPIAVFENTTLFGHFIDNY